MEINIKEEILKKFEKKIYDEQGICASYYSQSDDENFLINIALSDEEVDLKYLNNYVKSMHNLSDDIIGEGIYVRQLVKHRTFIDSQDSKYFIDDKECKETLNNEESSRFVKQYFYNCENKTYDPVFIRVSRDEVYINYNLIKEYNSESRHIYFICRYENYPEKYYRPFCLKLNPEKIEQTNEHLDVKVLNLSDMKMENVVKSNYNDDMRLATVYFDIKAIKKIREFAYVYGVSAIYKSRIDQQTGFTVDIINDKYIGISEGHYNSRVSGDIKKVINEYNIKELFEPPYFSKAIYQSHIEGKWLQDVDYTLKQMLGERLFDKYGYKLTELDIKGYYLDDEFELLKQDMMNLFDDAEVAKHNSMKSLMEWVVSNS